MALSSLRSDHNLRSGKVSRGSMGLRSGRVLGSMGARKRRCGIIWEIGDKVVILSAK